MQVIAITGQKRNGKDTIAKYLVDNYGFHKYAFADPMKEVAKFLFDWDDDYIENHKEEIDYKFGLSPRQFLQSFGTEYMQVLLGNLFPEYQKIMGRTFWVDKLIRTMNKDIANKGYDKIVISDMRFIHEYEGLKKYYRNDFESWGVVRPNYPVDLDNQHISEKELLNIPRNITVNNNIEGNIENLYFQVDSQINLPVND